MANKGKKGSVIWLLCTEDPEDDSKVQCNHCGIVLKKRVEHAEEITTLRIYKDT